MQSFTSTQRALSVRIPERFLQKASATISSHYFREYQQEFAAEHVSLALERWLDQHVDLVLEEVTELLTRPGSDEALEFARMLERLEAPSMDVAAETVQVTTEELHPMFSGNRPLSADRLAAMMGYFASKGIELYKTKLNKLLFYADLTGFYLTGRGLSGAQYVNLPYGPVPDRFEDMIDHAVGTGAVETVSIEHTDPAVRLIKPGPEQLDVLDDTDRRILDWVAENYGNLSTSAITDLSHEEKAYTDTRRGERIAYAYAQFLKKLPPKDII
ncbi:MAG: Panacea domain-containing protein [bacterium]|nr:Panacea domain-containing protein [bacterium]